MCQITTIRRMSCTATGAVVLCAGLCSVGAALADVIYQTNSPFGSVFGLMAFDVFEHQSVAMRFTPSANFRFDRAGVWFWNNDASGNHPLVTLTLRTDDARGGSIPSDEILEEWSFAVSAVGWDPVLEEVESQAHPLLHGGVHYWLVAESTADGGHNGGWNWAAQMSGFMSICNGDPCQWTSADNGAVVAAIIEGTPQITGDITADGEVGVDDLLAVIAQWGPCPAGPPASCPADIAPLPSGNGTVNVDDLLMVITNWG